MPNPAKSHFTERALAASLACDAGDEKEAKLHREFVEFRTEILKNMYRMLKDHESALEKHILPGAIQAAAGQWQTNLMQSSGASTTSGIIDQWLDREPKDSCMTPPRVVHDSRAACAATMDQPAIPSTVEAKMVTRPQHDVTPELDKEASSDTWMTSRSQEERKSHFDIASIGVIHRRKSLASVVEEKAMDTDGLSRWLLTRIAQCFACLSSVEEPQRTGSLARLVESNMFSAVCMAVICFNSLFMVVSTDFEVQHVGQEMPESFFYVDMALAIFYMSELLLKLLVHRLYFFCNDEMAWNIFDFVLVTFSVFEQSVALLQWISGETMQGGANLAFLRLVRLCKISKILRVIRTLRFFTELRLMVDCVVGSFVNAFWCITMLFFVLFLFALLFVQTLVEHFQDLHEDPLLNATSLQDAERWFGSVSTAVVTLFQCVTSGVDWYEPFQIAVAGSWVAAIIFVLFICLFAISIWNIITSTFVESALKLAKPDLDSLVDEKHEQDVRDVNLLTEIFSGSKAVGRDLEALKQTAIDLSEFRARARDEKFRAYLSARAIDFRDPDTFFNMLCSSSGSMVVEIGTLATACVRMKGHAMSIDLQTLSFQNKHFESKHDRCFDQMFERLVRIENRLHVCQSTGALS
eukprot:TRINITY_DN109382_c0_g1_i1.p1 TRINITY_DN109382_c0_g1~~TRINITY_DN109382_c0_g1_i1.p1  ORF type:complete len:637 (-),score=106.14 TRINITY_DN109382_c0_g1_i1:195-2105(-)